MHERPIPGVGTSQTERTEVSMPVSLLGTSHVERRPLVLILSHSQVTEFGERRDLLWDQAIEASAGQFPVRPAHQRHALAMGEYDPSSSYGVPCPTRDLQRNTFS